MPLTLSGTTGIAGVDGSAGTPATKGSDTDTGIVYGTNTVSIATNGTTAVTVDSSQNFGVGTATPGQKLDVVGNIRSKSGTGGVINFDSTTAGTTNTVGSYANNGAAFADLNYSANQHLFIGGGSERARIDSSGNLLVGTTVANAKVYGSGGGNSPIGRFDATLTSGYTSEVFQVIAGQPSGTGFKIAAFYLNNAAAYASYIRGDGTIFAVSTTIQAVSDARLKENIRDASEGLDTILGLKPRRFDWKAGEGNGKKNQIGFIAQEVETVFPDAVDVWEKPEDETEYKSVGASMLVPVLVKAFQELSAKLDAAEARIAALEAK